MDVAFWLGATAEEEDDAAEANASIPDPYSLTRHRVYLSALLCVSLPKFGDQLLQTGICRKPWCPVPVLDAFELGFYSLAELIAMLDDDADLASRCMVGVLGAGAAAEPGFGLVEGGITEPRRY